ncbi:arginine metabolism regulation protein II [Exophiala xenobiotica]|nr:arginine metabolism regulation protein II [Exophiala xenobiotica]KAK5209053.1 arginine metabolism regulation protein II [Exophiala xenobiotica]KAK5234174.1 arginine metabolism regulation protein II [Exophiala xenobiotica]KAK5245034.1 arginine metabolism regulation protein II [Exophiala xenobiotica]KAK5325136.1 arginine metabolism regulation protein II [Exophiala xenobiotica]
MRRPSSLSSPSGDYNAAAWPISDDWFSLVPTDAFQTQVSLPEPPMVGSGYGFMNADSASFLGSKDTFVSPMDIHMDLTPLGELAGFNATVGNLITPKPTFPATYPYGHPTAASLPNGSPYLPSNVRFLLSHYTNHVIDSLSPLPQMKAPWRGIHVPCALAAYGELDISGQSGFARVSLLYSLLSLTCYHLSSLYELPSSYKPAEDQTTMSMEQAPNAQYWNSQGSKFRNIARTAFRKCLQAMRSDPAVKVKYKELFVSAMSLICTGIISGDPWDSRFFILQCEEIVNKVGRTKQRFSNKALSLHRIFSYIRIIEQTTFVQTRDQYLETLDKHALFPEQLELVKRIPEHAFSHSATEASNLQTMSDLGLTGPEEETFYDLYGMPGSLLRLIARTNNVIAELDPPGLHGTSQPAMPPHLLTAAAVLESDICRLGLPSTDSAGTASMYTSTDITKVVDAPRAMRSHLATAMHHALLVYFFRFVRGTNPIILQHYVEKILTSLECHQESKDRFFSGARLGTTVWPSFIAACEALGENLRRRAVICMRHAAWAGFKNAEAAEVVAREVWRRRDAGENDVSWSTVLRESRTILLLT